MIVVSANIDRSIMFMIVIALVFDATGQLIAGAINDKSQFAKPFLIAGQFCALIAGILTTWIAKIYYEGKAKAAGDKSQQGKAEGNSEHPPHLHQLQKDGMTLNQLALVVTSIFLLSMSHAVQKGVVSQYIRNSFSKRMVDQAEL